MEEKKVTIKDIAKKLNVSVSTVSRAFNNYSDISESTKETILKVAEEMGYRPNIVAKSLSSNKNFRLGILIEDKKFHELEDSLCSLNPMIFEITMNFKNEASQNGFETVLLTTTSDMQKNCNIANLISDKQLDGLFIMGLKMTDEFYKQLKSIKYPCVLWDISVDNPNVCCIGSDNIQGAFIAVEYLIKQGHKKIGFINGYKEAFVSHERLNGYILALSKYGLHINHDLIEYCDFTGEGAYNVTCKLVKNKEITAIFCASDLMAIGCINSLENMGYSVPEDISVVGFDDITLSKYMIPRLTTIRQDMSKIGQTAAETLIELVSGKHMYRVLIKPELVIRESVMKLD